jgi:transglutaminase-like putative cysteine protease
MPLPPLIRPVSVTPYLACSPVISCTDPAVRNRARELIRGTSTEHEQIQCLYTYVRDAISHSVDAGQSQLILKTSQVMTAGHALCFIKSHLFVSLCRSIGIPAGLCYQRLKKEDGPYVLHGLASIWIDDEERWIRLDPRGNKPGVDAQFNPHGDEKIAFPEMEDSGEWLDPHIYPEPWDVVIHLFRVSPDVSSFINASSQIQTPPSHGHRAGYSLPVLV